MQLGELPVPVSVPRLASLRRVSFALLIAGGLAALALASERLLLLEQSTVATGSKAPKFNAKLLSDREIEFPTSYKGKLVLVDFWATWCGPCRGELPHLREAQKRFAADKFTILSVSLDAMKNRSPEYTKSFAEREKMSWDHVYDGKSSISEAYGVQSIPAAFLIDGTTGEIVASGDSLSGKDLLETIDKALKRRK